MALGNITDIIVINRNDIIICIVYWIKAIISPTWILPISICLAPNHIINIVVISIINIIKGCIKDIALFINRFMPVNSVLTLSNLSSSYLAVPKTLFTSIPDINSLVTRFILSTTFCIILNLGMANIIITIMDITVTNMANPIIHNMDTSSLNTLLKAPTAIKGP